MLIPEGAQRAASNIDIRTSCGMSSPVKARGDQRCRKIGSMSWSAVRPLCVRAKGSALADVGDRRDLHQEVGLDQAALDAEPRRLVAREVLRIDLVDRR